MVNLVMGLFRSTFDSIQLMGVGLQNCCFGLSRESQSYGPCVVDWGNPKCCCKFEVQLCQRGSGLTFLGMEAEDRKGWNKGLGACSPCLGSCLG